ncbi:MAG: hypothetical protein R2942_14810 [Ignavibacteria bacterium]
MIIPAHLQISSPVRFPLPPPGKGEEAQIMGVGAKIIENMNSSLTIPTATTFRTFR